MCMEGCFIFSLHKYPKIQQDSIGITPLEDTEEVEMKRDILCAF